MDLAPDPAAHRQIIEGYGTGTFRVSGVAYRGSVLVFPEGTRAWPVNALAQLAAESLAPVVAARPAIELLLVGCGARAAPLATEVRRALREAGIALEAMDTGAACRTYNVLVAEDRRVAAALIALD